MEEVFIAVPSTVTLDDISAVLRKSWTLDESLSQPHVVLDPWSRAYVAELDRQQVEGDALFFQDPVQPEMLRRRIGNYRLLALRYTDPSLAREMARAIATSELATKPMLLDADGTFLTPQEFIARLGEHPPWDWSSDDTA
jgi:hypothetical protein